MFETHLRSWTKAIVWRLLGFIILGLVTYAYTGQWSEALAVSSVFNIIRFFLYYVHERIWNRVRWGRHVQIINLEQQKIKTALDD